MKDLVYRHFPEATLISDIMDNLNTHTPAALYEAFTPAEARRILRKLDLRYTLKHGSWLNVTETEFAVLLTQRLDQRLPRQAAVYCAAAALNPPERGTD